MHQARRQPVSYTNADKFNQINVRSSIAAEPSDGHLCDIFSWFRQLLNGGKVQQYQKNYLTEITLDSNHSVNTSKLSWQLAADSIFRDDDELLSETHGETKGKLTGSYLYFLLLI